MSYLLGRRALCLGMAALGAGHMTSTGRAAPKDDRSEWLDFRARFLQQDGRLVDTGNGGVSHSEGQSYGMLLAAAHDDRPAFERIHSWTRSNLCVRDDHLMAWRYRHGSPRPVDDLNNATDGDLMAAWALARAHDRWGDPEHMARARVIARDMLRRLSVRAGGSTFLLPGAQGFLHGDRVVLNPSYHVVPAIRRMNEICPDPSWAAIIEGGNRTIETSRRGRWRLPPDWAQVNRSGGAASPSTSNPERFGYDAVRVPLNIVWSDDPSNPILPDIVSFWTAPPGGRMPGWVDLRSGGTSPEAASDGHRAIHSLATSAVTGWRAPVRMMTVSRTHDYYSSALCMLTRLALSDLGKPQAITF